jgi:hypothetical protein
MGTTSQNEANKFADENHLVGKNIFKSKGRITVTSEKNIRLNKNNHGNDLIDEYARKSLG